MLLIASAFSMPPDASAENILHIVGRTGTGLWHLVRHENLSYGPLYGDVLAQTGAPWTGQDSRTTIFDVAAHTVYDDLYVVIVIRRTPCDPFTGECSTRNPRFEVWQTVRRGNGSWDPFRKLTEELGGIEFIDVALGYWSSFDRLFLVGAARDGDVWLAAQASRDAAWSDLFSVKDAAGFDPGRVRAVSATRGPFGSHRSVAMVANGRVWNTFIDVRDRVGYKHVQFPGTPVGMDDITTRTGIPDEVAEVDVTTVEESPFQLHLIATSSDGGQWHALTSQPTATNWTMAGDIAGVGNPGVIRSAGISGFLNTFHLYDVVDTGKIFNAIRAASGAWSPFQALPSAPEKVGPFRGVAVAEFIDLPQEPGDVELTNDGCNIIISWLDRSNFENGYKIFFENKIVATTGPLDGGRGSVTVPLRDLEPGRLYSPVEVAAFTDHHEVRGVGTFTTTPARASKPNVLIGPRPLATWTYLPSSEGPADLSASQGVKVQAVKASDGSVVESPILPINQRTNVGPTKYEFGSNVNTAVDEYTFTVHVVTFGSPCTTVSEPTKTTPRPPPTQKPDLVFQISPTVCESGTNTCGIFPKLNEPFEVAWSVCNRGNANAGSSTTRLVQQTPLGRSSEDFSIGSLVVGACATQRAEFKATVPGDYFWDVFLDADTDVDEANESNNHGGVHKHFFRQ